MYIDLIINYDNKKLFLNKIHVYTSIYGLKYKILIKYKIPIEDQILNLNGRRLKNNKSILNYNLDKNSLINIVDSKLIGGSSWCSNQIWGWVGIFGGFIMIMIYIIPILPFFLHVYLYILKGLITSSKSYLCAYNRISAAVIGLVIGIFVLTGFVFIHNNYALYAYSLAFAFVFWLIGSKRIISFMEPMFRKECIYVDPEEKNIKECSAFSPAHLGFIPIKLISYLPYFVSAIFLYLSIFVIYTCLSLAVTNHYNCGSCNAINSAKKISKITTFIYIAIDLIYRLPVIFYKLFLNLVQYTFPFVFLKIIYDSFKGTIERFIYDGKYYLIYGFFDWLGGITLWILGLGSIFIFVGTLMQAVHTYISALCTMLYLIKDNIVGSNDYKYYQFDYDNLINKQNNCIAAINQIIKKNEGGNTKKEIVKFIAAWFIINGIKLNGKTLRDKEYTNFIEKIEDKIDSSVYTNKDSGESSFKESFKKIFKLIVESEDGLKGFIEKLGGESSSGLQGKLLSMALEKLPNMDTIKKMLEDKILYQLAYSFSVTKIIWYSFICRFSCSGFRTTMKERNSTLGLSESDKIRDLSNATGACKILQAVIIVKSFASIMRGMKGMSNFINETYDTPRDMADFYKVQNLAGTGAWFGWFVMICIYSIKHSI